MIINIEGSASHALKESVDGSFSSWFQGSKVVNADGTPKLMYRGDDNDIDEFSREYSASSNLYGTGFYFTDDKSQAFHYGGAKPYYLRIVHPLATDGHEITKKQLYDFLVAVDENEDYGLYNYGYGATPESVLSDVYGKSDFAMLLDINACCIGDLVEATLLFNKINATDFDGFILDTETVVFDNSQIRKAEGIQESNSNLDSLIKNVLREYREDQLLPFDGDGRKMNYMHLMDFIESMGKYGKLPACSPVENFENLISLYKAMKEFIEGDEYCYDYINFVSKFLQYAMRQNIIAGENQIIDTIKEEIEEDYPSADEISDFFYHNESLFDCILEKLLDFTLITYEGQDIFYDFLMKENFDCASYLYNYSFKKDKRNLIYIERGITIPKYSEKDFFKRGSNYVPDYYEYLKNNFSNLGVCWSYIEGGGTSEYCGEPYYDSEGVRNFEEVIFKGFVSPLDINWGETCGIELWMGMEESEVRLNKNAVVELDEVIVNGVNILKQPIVIVPKI